MTKADLLLAIQAITNNAASEVDANKKIVALLLQYVNDADISGAVKVVHGELDPQDS